MRDLLASADLPDPRPGSRPGALEERLAGALPRLRAHLARRGRTAGVELEDVAQEVLARALRYRASFDGGRALWPWLRRMADRVLSDQRAASTRRPAPLDDLDPPAPEVQPALESRDELERVLARLSARERDVLLRFHARGQSVGEIARELEQPEGTVKSWLSRARRRLAETETRP